MNQVRQNDDGNGKVQKPKRTGRKPNPPLNPMVSALSEEPPAAGDRAAARMTFLSNLSPDVIDVLMMHYGEQPSSKIGAWLLDLFLDQRPRDTMLRTCCEFMNSRLRRSRLTAAHKLQSTTATRRDEFDSGES